MEKELTWQSNDLKVENLRDKMALAREAYLRKKVGASSKEVERHLCNLFEKEGLNLLKEQTELMNTARNYDSFTGKYYRKLFADEFPEFFSDSEVANSQD